MKQVKITEEQFYEMFGSDRYKWIGNKSPDLDWWEPHINFVWDKEKEKTAGFRRTSSWNPDVEYCYLRERTKEEEKRSLEALEKLKNIPRTPYVPPKKPGLIEFLENDNISSYDIKKFNLADLTTRLEELWEDKILQTDRKITFFQGCVTNGLVERSAENLNICGDPKCTSCAQVQQLLIDL